MQLKDDVLLNIKPSCSVLAKNRITLGHVPQLDDFGCYLVPFLRSVAESRAGRGAGALLLSVLVPVLLRQSYVAVSPNTRTILLGPLSVLAVHLFARVAGLGVSLCTVGVTVLTLGSLAQQKSGGPEAVPVVPTPASAVYWSNLLVVLVAFSFGLQAVFDTSSPRWEAVNQAYILYPLAIVLPFISLGALSTEKSTVTSQQARKQLIQYNAEQVSYSFERTWSYHRKVALFSAFLYWFGLSRLYRGIITDRLSLNGPIKYILLNFVLASLYCVLAILVERSTVRPINSLHHPVTGAPRPSLVADCLKAISLAPAGSPVLERGTIAPILFGIGAGPGAAAALWWSGAEEENGWYSRRAWREVAATASQKKQ